MKLVHTADWHVGKVLKGVARLPEHEAVLASLVEVVDAERADVVVVAGDLFESAAPAPDAQALVWRTLLDLRATGAAVAVVAGNHDHAESLQALGPVWARLGVHVVGRPARPADGGVVELVGHHSADPIRLALLPWVSQRGVVRAQQLLTTTAAEAAQAYEFRLRAVIDVLTAPFAADAVNVLVAHTTVFGGAFGGGEREAQSIEAYTVSAQAFPATAHYVALGHLHRRQSIPAGPPVWYSGSPLAVDFGEQTDDKGVLVVEATPRTPATVRPIPLRGGRPLRTVRGSLAQLEALAPELGDALLRVEVDEPVRAGLAEEVRRLLPNALEVRLARTVRPQAGPRDETRTAATPQELFRRYLDATSIGDRRVMALFAELLDAGMGG